MEFIFSILTKQLQELEISVILITQALSSCVQGVWLKADDGVKVVPGCLDLSKMCLCWFISKSPLDS